MTKKILTLLGMPLDENAFPSPAVCDHLKNADLVVGENRKVTLRYLKRARANQNQDSIFFLDPPRKDEQKQLDDALRKLSQTGGKAALLADCGMPVLFDPGKNVLDQCRKLGFEIHSCPGPTSWATACSVSGWEPPFSVLGFLPRDNKERERALYHVKDSRSHTVLMDTPYRFGKLLGQLILVLGQKRHAFLAWEISLPNERFLWGSLEGIQRQANSDGLIKGEFVIIIKGNRRCEPPKGGEAIR